MTPNFPATQTPARFGSRVGVDALLTSACRAHSAELIGELLTPLFPLSCPWKSADELPVKLAQQHAPALKGIAAAVWAYRQTLTQSADGLRGWLDATDDDVRDYALRCAKVRFPGKQKLAWAVRVTGAAIPGKTPETQWARINDARFWRRAIRVRILREREHFYLRLELVGRGQEAYVSEQQLLTRTRQLRLQAEWMQNTVLVPRYIDAGEQAEGPLTLAQVASSPKTRFAKLYAFTKAMDEIATAEGLSAGMLTLTLEPEYHPNPSHGENSWNGASPRTAHRVMTGRWQPILRDLDHAGVGVSGLRVVEPHKDGCPHWHTWLLYRAEHEGQILATVMKYFPGKLKIRAPSRKGQKHHPDDRMYETRADLLAHAGRPLKHAKEGAQVELSRIERSISSGASYAMKYLLKTVDAGEKLNDEVDLFGNAASDAFEQKRAAHQETAKRVDAYRSLWGINSSQLFGVAKSLSAWDELRRLMMPPKEARLKKLWVLARGSDKPGRIPKGAGQRGNPRAFLEALGGLSACRKPGRDDAKVSIERLTLAAKNGYGETIHRPKGVSLVERVKVKVRKGQIDTDTGEIHQRSGQRSVKTVLASVVTRLTDWVLAPKTNHAFAVQLAQARVAHRSDPVVLGRQAVVEFLSGVWRSWDAECNEGRYPPRAAAVERPAPRQTWAVLCQSWGVAPLQPATA